MIQSEPVTDGYGNVSTLGVPPAQFIEIVSVPSGKASAVNHEQQWSLGVAVAHGLKNIHLQRYIVALVIRSCAVFHIQLFRIAVLAFDKVGAILGRNKIYARYKNDKK